MIEQKTIVQQMAEQRRQDAEFQKYRKVDIQNYKTLLEKSTVAKKLVWEILSYANFYNVNQSTDSSVQYTEGKRAVGKEIIELLNEISPSCYPKLMLEMGENYGRRSESNNSNNGNSSLDDTRRRTQYDDDPDLYDTGN
jgi:hypothetical protein